MNKKTKISLIAIGAILLIVFAVMLSLLLNRNNSGHGSENDSVSSQQTSNGYDEIVQTGEPDFGTDPEQTQNEDQTQNTGTSGITDPTQSTQETGGESATTKPTDATTPATTPTTVPETTPGTEPDQSQSDAGLNITYAQYMELSPKEQQALYDNHFADDPLAFAAWFQKIKSEHDDEHPSIIVTGPVDLEDYLNPSNP